MRTANIYFLFACYISHQSNDKTHQIFISKYAHTLESFVYFPFVTTENIADVTIITIRNNDERKMVLREMLAVLHYHRRRHRVTTSVY